MLVGGPLMVRTYITGNGEGRMQVIRRRLYGVLGEIIVPLLLLGYATSYFLEVRALPRPEINLLLIQPIYYILIASVLLFIGQVILREVRAGILDMRHRPTREPGTTGGRIEPKRSVAFAVTTVSYVFLIEPVGMVTMSAIYLFVLSWLLGVRSWLLLTLVPAGVVTGLYLVMERWLNLALPTGIAW